MAAQQQPHAAPPPAAVAAVADGGASTSRRVSKAIGRALGLWLVFYIIVIHLMVLWQWDADHDNNTNMQQHTLLISGSSNNNNNNSNGSSLLTNLNASINNSFPSEHDTEAGIKTLEAIQVSIGVDGDAVLVNEATNQQFGDVKEDDDEEEEVEIIEQIIEEIEEVEEEVIELNDTAQVEEAQDPEIVTPPIEEIVYVQLEDESDSAEETEAILDDLQAALSQQQAFSETIQHKMDSLQASLAYLRDKEQELATTAAATAMQVTAATALAPNLDSLQHLLAVESLSQLSNDALYDQFAKAFMEIDVLIANNRTISWDAVQSLLSLKHLRKEDAAATDACPKPLTTDQLDESWARDADLTLKVKQVLELLQRFERGNDGSDVSFLILLPTIAKRRIKERIAQSAVVAMEQLALRAAHEMEQRNADRKCVTTEQVVEMMDEGLHALQHRLDLRAALEQKTLAMEPGGGGAFIILDAILDRPAVPELSPKGTVNLRQVLDTPIVSQQLPVWIDGVEKVVGGHFDFVDGFLDSLVTTSITQQQGKARSSVGKVLVSWVLQQAGRFELPTLSRVAQVVHQLPILLRNMIWKQE